MKSTLPVNPSDVVEISSLALKLTLKPVILLANVFKFWDYPFKKGAASLEEMGLVDLWYWIYKSKKPVAKIDKKTLDLESLNRDSSVVKLPVGFEKLQAVTIGAGGDILRSAGIEHSKDVLFDSLTDILFEQDISYANYESPVTKQSLVDEVIGDGGAPIECSSQQHFDILTQHKNQRFNVLNTSNNHIFDMGVEGLNTTQQLLASEKILEVGTNANPEAYGKGQIITVNNLKIGFVSATFGLNGHEVPDEEIHRINVSKLMSKYCDPELDQLKGQINDCKNNGCDFIIASLHWGFEFEFFPRQNQVDAAHTLVECGADAIISHHPHVIQPVEYYRSQRDPNRIAVIAYSLGSLTWGFTAPHLVLSVVLNLTLAKGKFKGEEVTYIENAKVTPVFRSVTEVDGKLLTRMEKLEKHLDSNVNDHPKDYIDKIKHYADLVLG